MPRDGKIKVLVVDDSAFMRKMISDILNGHPDITVIGTASNGYDAVKQTHCLNPDVITLDILMPEKDGIEALYEIMRSRPTPVIMVTGMNKEEADIMVKCLEAGAVDFIGKPSGTVSLDIHKIKDELLEKVVNAAAAEVEAPREDEEPPSEIVTSRAPSTTLKMIALGASTGGPQVLTRLLPKLPKSQNFAMIIVQHMPFTFTLSFAERLAKKSKLEVKEAQHGDIIERGRVYVAPGDFHVVTNRKKVKGKDVPVLELNADERVHGVRPSIDVMMRSVARVFGKDAIGVILTGMGRDGAAGMRAIKEAGGKTIVQNRATSTVFGMPKAVLDAIKVDKVVPADEIAKEIVEML